jgi:ABC-type Co2+ transport system permease subunit
MDGVDAPEAHILSDFPTMAPFLIMPSVWPVPASSSVDLVTCTLAGMMMGIKSLIIGSSEVMDRRRDVSWASLETGRRR